MSERIQKVLAHLGLGSRREIEGWIEAGRITINGKVASLGDCISPTDELTLDGKVMAIAEKLEKIVPRVLLYHKPVGQICTQDDPQGRDVVFRHLPPLKHGRWIMVGRLDINTSGVLLFTTDGELANRLMHPKYQVEREYKVRVFGEVPANVETTLLKGVMLEDGLAKFDKITNGGGEGINHWYQVVIKEGRNREVRRLWESQDVQVSRLIRIRYASIFLPRTVKKGASEELSAIQMNELRQLVDLPEVADTSMRRQVMRRRHTKASGSVQQRKRQFNRR